MPTKKIVNDPLKNMSEVDKKIMAELHFFKGLTFVMMVMTFCIFLAFGALFSSMYMEVKLSRIALYDYLNQISLDRVKSQDVLAAEKVNEPFNIDIDKLAPLIAENFGSLSKYGLNIGYPKAWSSISNDAKQEVRFFVDGKARTEVSIEKGDLSISLVKRDSFAPYPSEDINILGGTGKLYTIKQGKYTSKIALVKLSEGNYVQLYFRVIQNGEEKISEAVMNDIVNGILQVK